MLEQLTRRELDAEIARRLFGEELHLVEVQPGRKVWRVYAGIYTDGEPRYVPALRYSTRIDYAWLVVERMRELGYARAMASWFVDEVCTGISGSSDYEPGLDELQIVFGADNLPELICRAALAAIR